MKEFSVELGLVGHRSGAFNGQWLSGDPKTVLESRSPIDRQVLATINCASTTDYEAAIAAATETFLRWRDYPAPKRGELVREIAEEFRKHKDALAKLITLEMGKILDEGAGEVQEVIDIADFAVGLSRQLYGLSMHSERPKHRMYEQWHPLGVVGVITAFNFPMAVWSWNAMIAAVCGNSVLWKPSELAPLSAIACTKIASEVAARHGFPGLFTLLVGNGPEIGKRIAGDPRIPLVSATGSTAMGRSVAQTVAQRLGRSLLELGGNNAIVVMDDADMNLAIRAVLFGAVGTAGQRCTSTRRILLHKSIADQFLTKLTAAYKQVKIGNPLEKGTLMGPLIHERAVEAYKNALSRSKMQGGELLYGGNVLEGMPSGLYVEPTIVKARPGMEIVREETFAPILWALEINSIEEAIALHNDVPQGLSSAIFTKNLINAETFLSHTGSDCGIANVNIGTSGAEIGGAFGGEKDTGGGREAGSDSWKNYMRRQTSTINWSDKLPLAQGIEFGSL